MAIKNKIRGFAPSVQFALGGQYMLLNYLRTFYNECRESFHLSPRRSGAAKANSTAGFTLIELLVVVAIIGMPSSIVLASLNTARQKGRDVRRISDVKQLQLALELYFDSTGSYPAATSALTTGGYISTIPKDLSDNTDYPYDQLGSGTGYEMCANLESSGSSVLSTDSTTVTAGGLVTSEADTTSCTGAANRYAYNVSST